jgi:hypothetical protein
MSRKSRKEINSIPSPLGEGRVNKPIIQHHQGEVMTRIEKTVFINSLQKLLHGKRICHII